MCREKRSALKGLKNDLRLYQDRVSDHKYQMAKSNKDLQLLKIEYFGEYSLFLILFYFIQYISVSTVFFQYISVSTVFFQYISVSTVFFSVYFGEYSFFYFFLFYPVYFGEVVYFIQYILVSFFLFFPVYFGEYSFILSSIFSEYSLFLVSIFLAFYVSSAYVCGGGVYCCCYFS